MKNKKKSKKWTRFRHRVVRFLAYPVFRIWTHFRYGTKIEKFKGQEKRPYLILLNHTTTFDQFFVGMAVKRPVYYMATEDIFSLGFLSKLLRWAVAPIPIKKQTTDIAAVMNCMRVAKEGGTICIAPEGNRSYSGRTEYMNPAIAGLAKKLKLPIVLFRIEGGYGVEPRWSDKTRKGKSRAYVAEVIQPEEAAGMTNEELIARVQKGLMVDETLTDGIYRSKTRAEYIERMIYVCPYCGLAEHESKGHIITCKKCGRQTEYCEDKTLKGVDFDFPFTYAANWYDYQKDYMNDLNVLQYTNEPMFRDQADVSEVILYQKKNLLRKNANIALYGDRIVFDEGTEKELQLQFSDTSAVSVLGRNKLNIYHGDTVYQLKGSVHFNALKYVHTYYRNKNLVRQNEEVFLGL